MGGHLNLTFSKWFSQTGPSATGTRAHVPKLHHGSAFKRLHPYDKTTCPNQLSANTSWNYPRSWLTKTCEFQVILPSRNTVLCLTQNAQAFVAHSLWTTQSYITKSFSERKQSIWLFFIEDRFYLPIPPFCSIPVSLLSQACKPVALGCLTRDTSAHFHLFLKQTSTHIHSALILKIPTSLVGCYHTAAKEKMGQIIPLLSSLWWKWARLISIILPIQKPFVSAHTNLLQFSFSPKPYQFSPVLFQLGTQT